MGLDQRLDDRETEAESAFALGVRFALIEDFGDAIRCDTGTVVGNRAFHRPARIHEVRIHRNGSARTEFDGIREQILNDPAQQLRVGVDDQLVRHVVQEPGARLARDRLNVL